MDLKPDPQILPQLIHHNASLMEAIKRGLSDCLNANLEHLLPLFLPLLGDFQCLTVVGDNIAKVV